MQCIVDMMQHIYYTCNIKVAREASMPINKIKLKRMELEMTQGELAKAVGVTRQTIGLIESGKYNPTLGLCISICRTLNQTLDQLFWEDVNEE